MNKITLLKIALLCSFFSFAQNIDTTKYQKITPGDTIRNYYNQNNNNNNANDDIKNYYPTDNNQQQNSKTGNQDKYQSDKSYPTRNQRNATNNKTTNNTNGAGKEVPKSLEDLLKEKLYYGAYVYVTAYSAPPYGAVTYYELSPNVGYKITDKFSAGFQILYNNSILSGGGMKPESYSIIGGGIFARYLFVKFLFLQVEYDILAVPSNYLGNAVIKRAASEEKMAGLGFKRSISDKFSYFIMLSYDFNPANNSPYYYDPLVYRLGFTYNW